MAVLSNAAREEIFTALAKELSRTRTSISLVKDELRAAINAADAWADANATSFNAAIPQPARGALTASGKARLLRAVIKRRSDEVA